VPRLIALLALAYAPGAWAHQGNGTGWFHVEPWAAAILAASAAFYIAGVIRLWRRAGAGRGISRADAGRFAAGWLICVFALMPPLDAFTSRSFAAHMVQHELMMAAAAPLLVLGRPLEAWTWALPSSWRVALVPLTRWSPLRIAWSWLTDPIGAWTIHAIAVWAWHVPAAFEAALLSTGLHIAQHASFMGTALFFWWSVFERSRRHNGGAALASVFTTMMHTGALGALLTFGAALWYPSYGGAYGLSALEDQQLGGLVMWGPAGLAYLVAGLVIASRWLLQPRRTAG
jgi:putative membrane protein